MHVIGDIGGGGCHCVEAVVQVGQKYPQLFLARLEMVNLVQKIRGTG